MRFKTFLEAFTDWSKARSDLDQSVKGIVDALAKVRDKIKANNEHIAEIRAERKDEKDAAKREKLNDERKKLEAENDKLQQEEEKLIDAKEKAEQDNASDSKDKSDSSDTTDNKGDEGGDKEDKADEPEKLKTGEPEKPELPNIEDVPLKKMKDSDIQKLLQYYKKMDKFAEYKRTKTKGKESFNWASRLATIRDEIKDLESEQLRRK